MNKSYSTVSLWMLWKTTPLIYYRIEEDVRLNLSTMFAVDLKVSNCWFHIQSVVPVPMKRWGGGIERKDINVLISTPEVSPHHHRLKNRIFCHPLLLLFYFLYRFGFLLLFHQRVFYTFTRHWPKGSLNTFGCVCTVCWTLRVASLSRLGNVIKTVGARADEAITHYVSIFIYLSRAIHIQIYSCNVVT